MDVDAQMRAVELDAVEHGLQRFRRRRQTVAEGIGRAFEDQREPGRALLEIVPGLRVGARRIGIVGALHDDPRLVGPAARQQRARPASRGISGSMAMPSSVRDTSVRRRMDAPP